MQKESDDSIVYVPTMHREFFPEGFSGGVKPLWPGLSSRYWGQRNPDAWHKISLPYTPTEAAACLAELAQLDEALATADVLVMLVDHSQFKVINGDNVHQQYVVDAKGVWR